MFKNIGPAYGSNYDRMRQAIPSYISAIPESLQGLDSMPEHGAYGLADFSGQYFPANMQTPVCISTPQLGLQGSRQSQLMTRVTQFQSDVSATSPCKFAISFLVLKSYLIFGRNPILVKQDFSSYGATTSTQLIFSQVFGPSNQIPKDLGSMSEDS